MGGITADGAITAAGVAVSISDSGRLTTTATILAITVGATVAGVMVAGVMAAGAAVTTVVAMVVATADMVVAMVVDMVVATTRIGLNSNKQLLSGPRGNIRPDRFFAGMCRSSELQHCDTFGMVRRGSRPTTQ